MYSKCFCTLTYYSLCPNRRWGQRCAMSQLWASWGDGTGCMHTPRCAYQSLRSHLWASWGDGKTPGGKRPHQATVGDDLMLKTEPNREPNRRSAEVSNKQSTTHIIKISGYCSNDFNCRFRKFLVVVVRFYIFFPAFIKHDVTPLKFQYQAESHSTLMRPLMKFLQSVRQT